MSSVLFFTVSFEGERHDLSKTGGFGRKMPSPPGKPVTFYECHPEDHAPAPSVRADLYLNALHMSVDAGFDMSSCVRLKPIHVYLMCGIFQFKWWVG